MTIEKDDVQERHDALCVRCGADADCCRYAKWRARVRQADPNLPLASEDAIGPECGRFPH